jgi:hypothetical protein
VQGLSLACQPIVDPPTYQAVFDQIFHPTCAAGSGTCHTPDFAPKGLIFADADQAYQLLLTSPSPRVLPKNPSCSLLMIRLESSDPSYRMPPGPTGLLPSQLCAIAQWIEQGAKR